MNDLRTALQEYLRIRRSLGFKLRGADRTLGGFLSFMEGEGDSSITTDLALRWAKLSKGTLPATWASRLQQVRAFAQWRSATDPRTEIPPKGLLPHRYPRKPPYIYSDEEIANLIQAAGDLSGLRGKTYSTLFGLLSVTGMRIGEALALDREHVDLEQGVLTVFESKGGKSRFVPVHESTRQVLAEYTEARDKSLPGSDNPAFFVREPGVRVSQWIARHYFVKVSCRVGLRRLEKGQRHGHGPRLHDMRHRFAARTLIGWYRAGLDVEREMPKLSTYLGHGHVNDTYWYLEAVPELLELATRRVSERWEVGQR